MNLADTIRMLGRRWYITFPCLILSIAVAVAAFMVVKPTYERSASLVLLPDASSIPEGGNPYLYLSGLTNVADVLTRAAADPAFLQATTGGQRGSEIAITRDPGTSSPVVAIKASAASDSEAARMLTETVDHVQATLGDLQASAGLTAERQITSAPLSMDAEGTVVQRQRLLAAGLAFAGGVLLSILLPAFVEGVSRRRRRRAKGEDSVVREILAQGGDDVNVTAAASVSTDTAPTTVAAEDRGKRIRKTELRPSATD